MNVLFMLHSHLTRALQTDPLHQLALLTSTLDPLWQIDENEFDDREGGGDLGLFIARRVFPDLYIEAVLRRQSGANDAELERILCSGFTQQGIPLDDIAFLGYGIPLTAYGITLDDPEVYTHRPDLLPLLALFGIRVEPGCSTIDIPKCTYSAASILADSLVQQTDLHWQQVGWLLAWLFGCSGNTLIDTDDEELGSIQPLSWDTDDVAFAIEMITEAQRVLDDADQAQAWLTTHPEALEQLSANFQHTYKSLKQAEKRSAMTGKKGQHHAPHIRLDWPTLADGAARAAAVGPHIL